MDFIFNPLTMLTCVRPHAPVATIQTLITLVNHAILLVLTAMALIPMNEPLEPIPMLQYSLAPAHVAETAATI